MYEYRSGFRPGIEDITIHARRRYRLMPSRQQIPNLPPMDPSLWLVHYFRAQQEHQLPTRNIPINDHTRHLISERNSLQSHGQLQLQHKEFMLRDRDNWPTINLPGSVGPSYTQQAMGYPNNVMAHLSRSQHPAYMQNSQAAAAQAGIGPSPAKRPRHASTSHGHTSNTAIPIPVIPPDPPFEDEETTSGVDYMDVLTPQEISNQRYKQHHEWLEEILNSPFDTRQIVPGELGLGRKGELESLTKDFFDAHTKDKIGTELELPGSPKEADYKEGRAVVEDDSPPRVGRMGPGKAEDFTKRAAQRMAELHAEMEKLKTQHARRMAKLSKGHTWRDAEQNLRVATLDLMNGNTSKSGYGQEEQVDQITHRMEINIGKPIKSIREIECVEKGGLEEKAETGLDEILEMEMSDSMTNLDGNQEPAFSETTMQVPMQSPDPEPTGMTPQASELQTTPPSAHAAQSDQVPIENRDAAHDDWVMVNREGDSAAQDQDQDQDEAAVGDPTTGLEMGPEDEPELPEDSLPTDNGLNFEDNDFETGLVDFGDLDTAGDELSGYAQEIESMGAKDQQALTLQEDLLNKDSPNPGLFSTSGDQSEPAS